MLPVTPKNILFETPPGATYCTWRLSRQGFVQKKPYDLLLPLTYAQRRCSPSSSNLSWDAVNSTGDTGNHRSKAFGLDIPEHQAWLSTWRNWALQDCKKRLANSVGEKGALLVSLVEYKQAMQMMESRLLQLYRFTRHMARFEFGRAAETILSRHDKDGWERFHHSRNKGRLKRGSKNLASNYLELHYGWLPTIGDIHTAASKLSNRSEMLDSEYSVVSSKYAFSRTHIESQRRTVHNGTYRFKAGCRFSMVNPNLYLAEQMGLINPYIAVAEVIKGSFLLDYIFNISEFCSQWTDFAGLKVVDQWYKESVDDKVTWTTTPGAPVYWPAGYAGGNTSFTLQRTVGALPTLAFSLRKPWQLSARRGGALASLLLTAMPGDLASPKARRLVTRSERAKYDRLGKLGGEYFR